MGLEFPDFLRGIALIGKSESTYLPVAVDPTGQLYIVLTGAPDVTIPGTVSVDDLNTLKQIQGTDGTVYRTAKVDASGQFVMVPRGQSGNYMAVDAAGYLTAILKGLKPDASLGSIAVDASGQLIMVPRGASGNYMNVDASGYLTAVLKGLYGSTLATVAVDASGRMVGLIADTGNPWSSQNVLGLAELASRLGAAQRYDPRGCVLDTMLFENGIPADLYVVKSGAETFETVPTHGKSSGYCAKIVTLASTGSYVILTRYIRTKATSKIGIEVQTQFSDPRFYMRLQINTYGAGGSYQGELTWNAETHLITKTAGGGSSVAIDSNAYHYATDMIYNPLKLVIDPVTGKFHRGLFCGKEYDLSAYNLYSVAASNTEYIAITAFFAPTTNNAITAYLDHMITTYAEPT